MTALLSLYPEGQMHQNQSIYFHFYDTVLLKQYLGRNVARLLQHNYTDALSFNLAHTINPKLILVGRNELKKRLRQDNKW